MNIKEDKKYSESRGSSFELSKDFDHTNNHRSVFSVFSKWS